MTFRGRVAVITGGGSGMGRARARRPAADGATVAVLDVDAAGLGETVDTSASIKPYVVDITDGTAVAATFAQIEADLGLVDRVANAAAIMPFGRLLEQDPASRTGSCRSITEAWSTWPPQHCRPCWPGGRVISSVFLP